MSLPDELDHLVRAVGRIVDSGIGRFAIVGGVAVAVRLGQAHRATQDVDAVVDDAQLPPALEVLTALPDATDVGGTLTIADAKVELLGVGPVPTAEDLGELSERQRLFLLGHSWALQTATTVNVSTTAPDAAVVSAPFATVSALVAMKLHAIQDRSGAQQDKRGGDAWDIHQLLTHHNARGELTRSFQQGPEALVDAVRAAVERVLLDGADRTRSWMRSVGGAAATVTGDELRALGLDLVS